eukprot:scaffold2848_cov352-Pavlova_lutheri.AAC.11
MAQTPATARTRSLVSVSASQASAAWINAHTAGACVVPSMAPSMHDWLQNFAIPAHAAQLQLVFFSSRVRKQPAQHLSLAW